MMRTMPLTLEQIVEETSQWPSDVVAELVDRIMLAKHGGGNAAVDSAWRVEAQRRLAELEGPQIDWPVNRVLHPEADAEFLESVWQHRLTN